MKQFIKSIAAVTLSLLMTVGVVGVSTSNVSAAESDTSWQNSYEYTLEGDRILITKFAGSETSVTVPATAVIDGKAYQTAVTGAVYAKATLTSIRFEDGVKIVGTADRMFQSCRSLESLDIKDADTSEMISMVSMFSDLSVLKTLDLSGWDTSKVTDFSNCFLGMPVVETSAKSSQLEELDLTGWDTSSATNMHMMFYYLQNLKSLDVKNFDTSNVTDFSSMFQGMKKLESIDVSGFDTSKATDITQMFAGDKSLTQLDVRNFNTSNVESAVYVFGNCAKLESIDISDWNLDKLLNGKLMFGGDVAVKSIKIPDTPRDIIADLMFYNCTSLESLTIAGKPAEIYVTSCGTKDGDIVDEVNGLVFPAGTTPHNVWTASDFEFTNTTKATKIISFKYKGKTTEFKVPAGATLSVNMPHNTEAVAVKWVDSNGKTFYLGKNSFSDNENLSPVFAELSSKPAASNSGKYGYYCVNYYLNGPDGNTVVCFELNGEEYDSISGAARAKIIAAIALKDEYKKETGIAINGTDLSLIVQSFSNENQIADMSEYLSKTQPDRLSLRIDYREYINENYEKVIGRYKSVYWVTGWNLQNLFDANQLVRLENPLIIKKTVESRYSEDSDTYYNFEVELTGLTSGKEYYIALSMADKEVNPITFKADSNGSATVELKLKDGQYISFPELDENAKYIVTEDVSDDFDVEITKNGEAINDISVDGTIGSDQSVEFRNTRVKGEPPKKTNPSEDQDGDKEPSTPVTRDNTQIFMYAALFVSALVALIAVAFRRRLR